MPQVRLGESEMTHSENSDLLISTKIKRPYGTWVFKAQGAQVAWDVETSVESINIKALDRTTNMQTEITLSQELFLRILANYAKSGTYAYTIEKSARRALMTLAEAIEAVAKK